MSVWPLIFEERRLKLDALLRGGTEVQPILKTKYKHIYFCGGTEVQPILKTKYKHNSQHTDYFIPWLAQSKYPKPATPLPSGSWLNVIRRKW